MAQAGGLTLVFDENWPSPLVKLANSMRPEGFQIVHCSTYNLLGLPDDVILSTLAEKEGHILITNDRGPGMRAALASVPGARAILLRSPFASMKSWDKAAWLFRRLPSVAQQAAALAAHPVLTAGVRGKVQPKEKPRQRPRSARQSSS